MLCINSSISSGRMGMPAIEPMPRINPRNSARNFRLMVNESSKASMRSLRRLGYKRSRPHRAVGVSCRELRPAANTFTSSHHEFSGTYATGGARERSSSRQGNSCTEQLSASRRRGATTSATEKRNSGTSRKENTPQTGSSPANNTNARQNDASDLREESIIQTSCQEDTASRK